MKGAVTAVWGGALLAGYVVVVPAAVTLLGRTLEAARQIERYTEAMKESGAGIARNTASVAALRDTVSVATELIAGAEAIGRNLASIEGALTVGTSETRATGGDGVVGTDERLP